MRFMRASNRSHWQHNDNVGFHLKFAATLSNQWGPLVMLCEQLDYNLLFRWFIGLSMDDPVWDHFDFFQEPGPLTGVKDNALV